MNDNKEKIQNKIIEYAKYQIEQNYPFSLKDKIGLCMIFSIQYSRFQKEDDYNLFCMIMNSVLSVSNYTATNINGGSSGVLWLLKYLKDKDVISYSEKLIKPLQTLSCFPHHPRDTILNH